MRLKKDFKGAYIPNVPKAGGLQSPGEAVISYRNPLIPPKAGQDLKSSVSVYSV
jgi:hypothetical protein